MIKVWQVCLLCCCVGQSVAADKLKSSIDMQKKIQQSSAQSQAKINQISQQNANLFQEYRQVIDELETLQVYNRQLEKLALSQQTHIELRNRQLAGIERTEQAIIPLMLRMVDTLGQFIDLDAPFLQQERKQRVTALQQALDAADVSTAEKYRQILQAFLIEISYGRTIEAYQAAHPENAAAVVDFLRIGRLALLYQTLDGQQAFYWSAQEQGFKLLPALYRQALERGFRVARKQAAPEFLKLPIPAPLNREDDNAN